MLIVMTMRWHRHTEPSKVCQTVVAGCVRDLMSAWQGMYSFVNWSHSSVG